MTDKDFYSPAEVNFSKPQVLWLIKHLPMIRVGSWPPDFLETGYTGSKKRTINHHAYYETPVSVSAELDWRLECCQIDGILLEFIYSSDSDDKVWLANHVAQAMNDSLESIEKRIGTALRYCCGYRRKNRTYKQFRSNRKGG